MKQKILVILTGGTIDSLTELGKTGEKSYVKDYLKSLNLHIEFQFQQVCLKDSRNIDNQDKQTVVQMINNTKINDILITHGTFTMCEMAKYLTKHINNLNKKKIVLTGAMEPLKNSLTNEAQFNLGFAIATILQSNPGIFIAINGKIFEANNVYKNIDKGMFEELN